MIMSKKVILILLLLISCSIGTIAQTSYYYYKGMHIPLILNESKVCVSILKNKKEISTELLKSIKILDKKNAADYELFTIQQSDLQKISALSLWEGEAKSILLSPCFRTIDSTEVFLTPYFNVRLKREQDINLLSSYAERYGLRIVKQNSFMPLWYGLSISSKTGKNALEIANELWESGLFAASSPNFCSNGLICSNDPMFDQQWGLHNIITGVDISVSSAWNYSTGKNVKIAILDTGVDLNHIDLAANISNLSYDTESASSPSVVYHFHGTHCAGIAAAVKDNGIQIAGVAPEATIVSISNSFEDSMNDPVELADGINWAYEHGVDIISNSWHASGPNEAIDEAINNAFKYGRQGKGCVIVFASGNRVLGGGDIFYPANSNDTILAVGAINRFGWKAYFSNYGEELDLVAPGVSILSTIPNDSTKYEEGTSMACPHVAGVAALILERNSELTVNQVNSIICRNAKKLPDVTFNYTKPDGSWNNKYGYGLVDAYSSVINTPGDAYIQNDTITGIRIISADSLYVGRNVTDTKEYGDVILGQGDITMKAKYVKIKNSTTVPLGTKLKIEN